MALVLRDVHHGERSIAGRLGRIADRHRTDAEVRHIALDLARWSRENLRKLAALGPDRGVHLSGAARTDSPALLSTLQHRAADVLAHRPEPGLLLLHDLRQIYMAAAGNSLRWELLAQVAEAAKDKEALDVASACHPQTLRQMRWANTMIKTLSPQVILSI